MSDMDPDGMDSELEGEGDTSQLEQQAKQPGTPASHDKANPIRSRRVDEPAEGENEDEEDEDMEPRSTPRSASQPPYDRRESDRNRPSPSGDRRR
jgi:hypothetical protein